MRRHFKSHLHSRRVKDTTNRDTFKNDGTFDGTYLKIGKKKVFFSNEMCFQFDPRQRTNWSYQTVSRPLKTRRLHWRAGFLLLQAVSWANMTYCH